MAASTTRTVTELSCLAMAAPTRMEVSSTATHRDSGVRASMSLKSLGSGFLPHARHSPTSFPELCQISEGGTIDQSPSTDESAPSNGQPSSIDPVADGLRGAPHDLGGLAGCQPSAVGRSAMRRIQIGQHLSRMRMGVSDLIESGVDLGNVIRRNRKHGDFLHASLRSYYCARKSKSQVHR